MEAKTYKLCDSTIAQIIQLVQMGILTGTDITDQIRTLRVVTTNEGTVSPDPGFVETFNKNLEKLTEMANNEEAQGQIN
jgi:hypothetical protein